MKHSLFGVFVILFDDLGCRDIRYFPDVITPRSVFGGNEALDQSPVTFLHRSLLKLVANSPRGADVSSHDNHTGRGAVESVREPKIQFPRRLISVVKKCLDARLQTVEVRWRLS